MKFNHFLSAYYPDTQYGAKRFFDDMVAQAVLADSLGYRAVSIPEHHGINILLTPSPLQMAVKIAAETSNVEIATSIAVLPIRDMRIFAGEVIQADCLCDGRLVLGVGRGAFKYEIERMGVAMQETRDKFDESLEVLQALLTQQEVSWDGDYYKFDSLTVMPRPMNQQPPQIMIAAMAPEAIYHCARRGFHIQTAPLAGNHQLLLDQVAAFQRAKNELGAAGEHLRLSVLRTMWLTQSATDSANKMLQVEDYYKRFDNVFSGPGEVHNGAIAALPRQQSIEDLELNMMVCNRNEMIDKIGLYQEAGIEEIILSSAIDCPQQEVLEMMQRFAQEIMPHFSETKTATNMRD